MWCGFWRAPACLPRRAVWLAAPGGRPDPGGRLLLRGALPPGGRAPRLLGWRLPWLPALRLRLRAPPLPPGGCRCGARWRWRAARRGRPSALRVRARFLSPLSPLSPLLLRPVPLLLRAALRPLLRPRWRWQQPFRPLLPRSPLRALPRARCGLLLRLPVRLPARAPRLRVFLSCAPPLPRVRRALRVLPSALPLLLSRVLRARPVRVSWSVSPLPVPAGGARVPRPLALFSSSLFFFAVRASFSFFFFFLFFALFSRFLFCFCLLAPVLVPGKARAGVASRPCRPSVLPLLPALDSVINIAVLNHGISPVPRYYDMV